MRMWRQLCRHSLKLHQQREPLKLHTVPDLPWSIVTTDIFEWENHHYLILVNSYSGWFEVDHFSVHGLPKRCVQTCVRGSESNGLSKRAMRSPKKPLETTKRDGTDFYLNLLNLRNTTGQDPGFSSSETPVQTDCSEGSTDVTD